METKKCTQCKQDKELTREFWPLRSDKKFAPECRECRKAYLREWRRKNPDYASRAAKQWRADNPEKRVAGKVAYRKANPGKMIEMAQNRRARVRGAEGTFTEQEFKDKYIEYNGCCAYCGRPIAYDKVQRDHVVPLARGGNNFISNIVPACRPCNSMKGDRLIKPSLNKSPVV
jgi:5-methylcytosine-specific restriction endonuclease McrA